MNPGRTIRVLGLALALIASSMGVRAQQQRVEVQLSANRVSVDESVMLNVRAYGLDKDIVTSALDKDFDVTNRSSSRQVTIENGKRTSLVEWVFELAPKRAGAIEIPPIEVGSEQSRPLTLLVEPPPSGAARDMYLEASVDISDPYVQAQVIYTLRVFQDVRFLEASLQEPEVEGVDIQQISDEKTYEQTVNGRAYLVSEISYAVFPKQSGDVVIPPFVLHAVIPVDQNQVPNTRTRTRRIKRRANQIELNVQSRPDGLAGSWWLPAKEVQLQSEWSSPIDAMEVDQPVTRTIQLIATGVNDAQLPEFDVPAVDDISIYADSPTAETNADERGLISVQTNTWAVIPQTVGELVLPEVKVNWFDTATGEARVAVLPAETITVVGTATNPQASNSATPGDQNATAVEGSTAQANTADDTDALAEETTADSTSEADNSQQVRNGDADAFSIAANPALQQSSGRWRNIAAMMLVGWVLSLLGLWLWMRKRATGNSGAAEAELDSSESISMRFRRRAGSNAALEPVVAACDSADASKISTSVLSWAAMMWPDAVPTHISDVAKRLKSVDLAQAFEVIDAQQYRASGSVNSVAADQIPTLLKQAVEQYQEPVADASRSHALPGL